MQRLPLAFLLILATLLGLWWSADPSWPQPWAYFPARAWLLQATGVLAIGSMSVILVLATRPRWLEPALRGMDKIYRLHKWLGITALVTATVHWWLAQGTKWMVGWGWLARPVRSPRSGPDDRGALEAWLGSQRHLAETIGEWAFYIAAALMVLALVRRVPYRWFARTHTVLAASYLALVFHAVVLVKFGYWRAPVGWLLALLMAAGSVAAVLVLARQVGARRRMAATVTQVQHYPGVQSMAVQLRPQGAWPGHRSGQFAFVRFADGGEPHPFTIASAWDPARPALQFVVKALGDDTRRLLQQVAAGQTAEVEGPYGGFDFEDDRQHQVWIGAGIGITPFIARLQQLASLPADERRPLRIDLVHPTAQEDPHALARLTADARAAGVQLHVLVDARDGRLDGDRLEQLVRPGTSSSLWFCGPSGFGLALRRWWVAGGRSPHHFHQELFELR